MRQTQEKDKHRRRQTQERTNAGVGQTQEKDKHRRRTNPGEEKPRSRTNAGEGQTQEKTNPAYNLT